MLIKNELSKWTSHDLNRIVMRFCVRNDHTLTKFMMIFYMLHNLKNENIAFFRFLFNFKTTSIGLFYEKIFEKLVLLYFFIILWYSFSSNNRKKDRLLLWVILGINFRFLCFRILLKGVFFVICEINWRDIKN